MGEAEQGICLLVPSFQLELNDTDPSPLGRISNILDAVFLFIFVYGE